MPEQQHSFFGSLRVLVNDAFNIGDQSEKIFDLVRDQQFTEALRILADHPELWSSRDSGGHSLLHWAALGGSIDFVQCGLSRGASVDVHATQSKQTPVTWAAWKGHLAIVRELVAALADLHWRDARGCTPIMTCAQFAQNDSIKLLVELGGHALLEDADGNGCTAAHWAAFSGKCETLRLLATLGANLEAQDHGGMLPLHRAAQEGSNNAVAFLVSEGIADPSQLDGHGRDSADLAALSKEPVSSQRAILSGMLERLLKPTGGESTVKISLPAAPMVVPTGVLLYPPDGMAPLGVHSPDANSTGDTVTMKDVTDGLRLRGERIRLTIGNDWNAFLEELKAQLVEYDQVMPTLVVLRAAESSGKIVQIHSAQSRVLTLDCVASTSVSADQAWHLSSRTITRKGCHMTLVRIPSTLRWQVWMRFLCVDDASLPTATDYADLHESKTKWSEIIMDDVNRSYKHFDSVEREGMVNVLNAYAAHKPEIGYCQGMHMIVGFLLTVSGNHEEESFRVFACLMCKVGLDDIYREGFPLLLRWREDCERSVREWAPDLHCHLDMKGVQLGMYLDKWFLTLFVGCLPPSVVVGIWDAIIYAGSIDIAAKVAVSLLRALAPRLSSLSINDIADAFKLLGSSSGAPWEFCFMAQLLQSLAGSEQLPAV